MKSKKIEIDLANSQEARNVILAIFALTLLAIYPIVQTMIAGIILGSMLYVAAGSGAISGGILTMANVNNIVGAILLLLSEFGIESISLDTIDLLFAIVAGIGLGLFGLGIGLL
ncbi:hypothetical protein [Sulfurisphaera ohwakuensis]|uniref:Putative permease n=1 Tax=Sulfurisphaera ohwakuensis TaxID=69656 RepID=A0A650CFQ9_SULOH|nr:hypothetical protein [Sulfurisphaera ohwakuensis]MBB5255138.1 putative permease [Sulfurisphaera ohwakuensis]QGR16609.1 hypothetical protein D1869_04925 [Sulfurisphaera ohwakuensis]